ncbi:TatD family hydrolase [Gardnerella vaginalis]|uniref:TatD family hydrolase n=1 Tax=Gardnerella vaginalis TaxID=2702 RepID=UPI001FF54A23|nr:TatD family hydrolase [Gardnerella vaginalis]
MSKHHREHNWAPELTEESKVWENLIKSGVTIADDHTHMLSVVDFAHNLNQELAEKGREPINEPTADDLVTQAKSAGVSNMLEVGCEYPDWEPTISFAASHAACVRAAIAIHPNEAVLHGHRGAQGPYGLPIVYKPYHDIPFDEAMQHLRSLVIAHPKEVVAIGETGLDYFRTGESARLAQREAFRDHIALAKELNLPLQIHDRDAHEDVVKVLLQDGAPERTVFHSYAGGEDLAQILKEHGWYASFSGTLSYKGNEELRKSARIIGESHITVETDAPYLTPMPYRGRPNAPYMVPYTLQVLANVLDISLEKAAKVTRENTKKIYGF